MFFTLRQVFAQKETMYLLQTATRQYESSFKDTSVLGTFVDNHDNDRYVRFRCRSVGIATEPCTLAAAGS